MTRTPMHRHEVAFDASVVQELVAGQYPELAGLPVSEVTPSGTDNRLFRLGDDLVARLPVLAERVATLEHELRWLPRVSSSVPLATPEVVAVGAPGDGYPFPWAIYRWLDGDSATFDPPHGADDLATFIEALHRIDVTGGPLPGPENSWRGVPLARRDSALRSYPAAEPYLDEWESLLASPEWTGTPVWLHGDLDARNLLAREGRLSAVIDWGCVVVGDPACDIAVAWKMLSAPARDAFRAALDIDDATWARARGWVLSQAVMALGYYTLETNASLVQEAERWLAELER